MFFCRHKLYLHPLRAPSQIILIIFHHHQYSTTGRQSIQLRSSSAGINANLYRFPCHHEYADLPFGERLQAVDQYDEILNHWNKHLEDPTFGKGSQNLHDCIRLHRQAIEDPASAKFPSEYDRHYYWILDQIRTCKLDTPLERDEGEDKGFRCLVLCAILFTSKELSLVKFSRSEFQAWWSRVGKGKVTKDRWDLAETLGRENDIAQTLDEALGLNTTFQRRARSSESK